MKGWIIEWVDRCKDGALGGLVDRSMNTWMDGLLEKYLIIRHGNSLLLGKILNILANFSKI